MFVCEIAVKNEMLLQTARWGHISMLMNLIKLISVHSSRTSISIHTEWDVHTVWHFPEVQRGNDPRTSFADCGWRPESLENWP